MNEGLPLLRIRGFQFRMQFGGVEVSVFEGAYFEYVHRTALPMTTPKLEAELLADVLDPTKRSREVLQNNINNRLLFIWCKQHKIF